MKKKPKVYNMRHPHPKDAVYIGRGSIWGNPYKIGKDGSRAEVIEKYRKYFIWYKDGVASEELENLRGKDLVCYCKPLPCHGDVIMEILYG